MAGTRQRRHCDLNRCGILDEISSELLRRITERYPSRDSRPPYFERVKLRGDRISQRMRLIEAIGDRERIEDTNIVGVQNSLTSTQIDMNAPVRDRS